MKRLSIRFAAAAAAVVLAAGLLTYFYLRRRWSPVALTALRVLCAEDWLEGEALDRFARSRDARIELYTYRDPAEFLRQLANADGRVDVLCTSSLLLKGLVRSTWIKKFNYQDLPRARELAADFLHLPYDPTFEYGFPVHWQVFGYLSSRAVTGTIKQWSGRGRVGVWSTPLEYMALLTEAGVAFEDRLETEDPKKLDDEVQRFVSTLTPIVPDLERADPKGWLARFEAAHVPSLAVPPGAGFFAPAEDGGIVDVGLLAVGERAPHPDLALALIAELSAPAVALPRAVRLGQGTTLALGEGDATLKPAQRPSALRATPLTRMRFPDVNGEALLRYAKLFANARRSAR